MIRDHGTNFILILCLAFACLTSNVRAQSPREIRSFDQGWSFLNADQKEASDIVFPDEKWAKVDLPHDWAIAGPFEAANASGGAGGFAPAGVGWYRKRFVLSQADSHKHIYVEFDGVMANSDVWINGAHLGHRPNGYVSFHYELTGHLKFGNSGPNVIAVRADNSKQPSSRWYEGAGIYRHVRLVLLDPIHTTQWSTFISTPSVSRRTAKVSVQTEVANETGADATIQVKAALLAPGGNTVARFVSPAQLIPPGGKQSFKIDTRLLKPDLWDIDHPVLYRAKLVVTSNGKIKDSELVTFGIRDVHFEPATGFWINGRNIKIKGVALHSDVGSLGMAAPLGAWEHRLNAMRMMGANAIRTAHNPVAPEFLDLCDRLGFLVMDEMFDQWTVAKNPYDYHLYFRDWYLTDVHDTVLRDRNHPSVILWSAGNEIHDTPNAELAKSLLAPMIEVFHKADPTRPVTQALFRPNVSHDYEDGFADMLDVVGQNYRPNEVLAAYAQKPTRKMLGTENIHDLETWLALRDHAEYSGQFLWSGTDYLGESRHWPVIGDASGMYDRTDAPKPDGLERQSWWNPIPVVHIVRRVAPTPLAPTDPGYEADQYRPLQTVFPDWSPINSGHHDEKVEIYSNCEEVELFLNGQSLGAKFRNADDSPRIWSVGFVPGMLRAEGRNKHVVAASETLRTAESPAKLMLTVERARLSTSWDDVAYLRAEIMDKNGTIIPNAANLLHFSVVGPARILATDNGDNADHSGFQKPDRAAYKGAAIVIIRATRETGAVTVRVDTEGLYPAMKTLQITPLQ